MPSHNLRLNTHVALGHDDPFVRVCLMSRASGRFVHMLGSEIARRLRVRLDDASIESL